MAEPTVAQGKLDVAKMDGHKEIEEEMVNKQKRFWEMDILRFFCFFLARMSYARHDDSFMQLLYIV